MIKMGCKHHSDCNTCPFDDCVASVKSLSKKAKSKGDRSQYFADYYQKNKDTILAKRKEDYKKKKREM